MIDNCPLCNAGVAKIKFMHGEFVYKLCPSCRSLFVANELSALNIRELYSESYYEADASNSKGRKGYPSYREAQESLKESFFRKLSLVRARVPSGRLLDAGAAYGTFLKVAHAYYDCVGLEVSEYAVARAREEFGVDVRLGNVEQAPFVDAEFDVVVMWDIIEHLRNPVFALQEIHRMLKPGGYCFISTDDASNWLIKLLGTKWWAIAPPLHLCHFSKKGMLAALGRAGNFDYIEMKKDRRKYSIPEIIRHFGVSYQSRLLTDLGTWMGRTPFDRLILDIARPEQFVTIARKRIYVGEK